MRKVIIVMIVMMLIISGVSTIVMAAANNSETVDSVYDTNESKDKKSFGYKKDGFYVNVVEITASILGKTDDEVKTTLKDGKIGDLLIAAGKVDDFKTAYLAELKSKPEAAVTTDTLTADQADEKYASEKEKMDAYDGTTHLCGGSNHGKMFDKKFSISKINKTA